MAFIDKKRSNIFPHRHKSFWKELLWSMVCSALFISIFLCCCIYVCIKCIYVFGTIDFHLKWNKSQKKRRIKNWHTPPLVRVRFICIAAKIFRFFFLFSINVHIIDLFTAYICCFALLDRQDGLLFFAYFYFSPFCLAFSGINSFVLRWNGQTWNK